MKGTPLISDPSGRFHLVEAPALLPANDFITKTTVGPFIDTGAPIRDTYDDVTKRVIGNGRLYIAVSTIREMAEVAGLFDAPQDVEAFLDGLEARFTGDQLQNEYNRGYDAAVKENLVGHLRDVAGELVAAADRLTGSPNFLRPEVDAAVPAPVVAGAGPIRDAVPADGGNPFRRPEVGASGADETASPTSRPRGQRNVDGGKRRPARVPGGSGDGDANLTV